MKVPFFKPSISEAEVEAVADTVRSGWLTFGAKTEEFEKAFAKYIGAPYCVMVDNCTAAIHLACEYHAGDIEREFRTLLDVGVPSLTCAATILGPLHAGFSVHFEDLAENDSFLAEPDLLTELFIPVHYAGKRNNGRHIYETVVEDCAHYIIRNGFHGQVQAYSFYVTKNLTTGEGGMIACNNKKQAEWFRKARLYGNSKAIFERKKMYATGKNFWWFESEFEGWKANPTDIAAAIGLVQLKRLDELNAERERIATFYNEAFDLTTDRSPWHLYPMLVNDRDEFMHYMKNHGVACSVHFPPLHMMKAFKQYATKKLPMTEWVYKHIVSLPLYPYMTEEEQGIVIDLVLEWIKNHGRARLKD